MIIIIHNEVERNQKNVSNVNGNYRQNIHYDVYNRINYDQDRYVVFNDHYVDHYVVEWIRIFRQQTQSCHHDHDDDDDVGVYFQIVMTLTMMIENSKKK